MKSCEKCGMIYDEITGECPNCSRLVRESSYEGTSWPALKLWFSSPLTLTLAIITSVSAALSIACGSIPLFAVLLAIALWIAYSAAKAPGVRMSPTGLKMISGTLKAMKIIVWVCVGLCLVSGIIVLIGAPAIPNISAYELFSNQFVSMIPPEYANVLYGLLASVSAAKLLTVVGVGVIVIAVVLAVFNIFFYRNAHKLAKSISVSCETGIMQLAKHGTVKAWLIVFAAIQFITGASSISYSDGVSVLQWLCNVALYVIGFIWLKKYIDSFHDAYAAGHTTAEPVEDFISAPPEEKKNPTVSIPESVQQVAKPYESAGAALGDLAKEAAQQFASTDEEVLEEKSADGQNSAGPGDDWEEKTENSTADQADDVTDDATDN